MQEPSQAVERENARNSKRDDPRFCEVEEGHRLGLRQFNFSADERGDLRRHTAEKLANAGGFGLRRNLPHRGTVITHTFIASYEDGHRSAVTL